MSEWRQFRLLVRVSLGRLMDAAVASREIDGVQFVIWSFALMATPAFFYAARMMGKYVFLARRPEVLAATVLADRLFFIVYMMLATALLAAVLWDALSPDRQDQEIVGVLPVRPRTLAAARLAAALLVVTGFSAFVAIPSGFMYMLNVAAAFRAAEIVGWWPAVFVAHAVTVTAAGIGTFAALLAVRGLAVACMGARAVQRAAIVLQLVTVVLVVESLIFLPGVLFGLVNEVKTAAHMARWPPLWFLALYATMGGRSTPLEETLAVVALAATATTLLVATLAYLAPARWNARRAMETPVGNRASRAIAFAQWMATPVLRLHAARAVFGFVLASLTRSPRHALIVATYLGFAVAVAGIRLMAAVVRNRPLPLDAPADYLLSLPLVLTFFLAIGLRVAFAVPTDVGANWTFRVAHPKSAAPCVDAVGVAFVGLAVLPVTVAWFGVTASLWDSTSALAAAAMHAASGVALVELLLLRCEAVPFTRAHAPASSAVRGGWALALVALNLYAFQLDDVQLYAIGSTTGVGWYVGVMLMIAAAIRIYRRVRRPLEQLAFDAPVERTVEPLNLSQAIG